jgi:cystathionine gamma-synthase
VVVTGAAVAISRDLDSRNVRQKRSRLFQPWIRAGAVLDEADPRSAVAACDDRGVSEDHRLPADARFATLAVHAGQEPDELTGAVAPPIYQTSTYAQDGVGRPRRGYEYARSQNPTRERLERAVAALEGGAHGIAFASGSATTAAIAELARPGTDVVVGDDVYGGTFRYLDRVRRHAGVPARYVDLGAHPDMLWESMTESTALVWFETPSNPLLKIIDVAGVVTTVRERAASGAARPLVVVDNTFATPVLQRPLELGADIVFHSATKYLGGHSDTVVGVAVTADHALADRLRFLQNAMGGVPGPFDCFLVLRGLRTLALRVERHCANAARVAAALAARDDVELVRYPGLADGRHAHPQAALALRQMGGRGGGMVSFVPRAGGAAGRTARERAVAVCETTRVFTLAESLGGVESLIEMPAVMTHASVAGSALEVPEALVRLSVGIEDPEDLVADLTRALDAA